jgi:hypothetical protein
MTNLINQISEVESYQSFIVFDPASIRVPETDIFIIGPKVSEIVDQIFERISEREQDIKMKILINKISKLRNMLDLVGNQENIIISKFFHRIWRRYSYISHLGEAFLDLQSFSEFFPELIIDREALIANRLDISDEDEDSFDDDDDDDVDVDTNDIAVETDS